jgi:hypothetical protein
MAQDLLARGLAARAMRDYTPVLEDFGGSPDAPVETNRIAFRNAYAAGTPRLALNEGTYLCSVTPWSDPVVYNHTTGYQPSIIIGKEMSLLDGRGATIAFTDNSRGIMLQPHSTWAHPTPRSYIAADVAAGDTQLTLEPGEGAKWQVGDELLWQFGSIDSDLPETLNWGFAKVTSVTGDIVAIDRPMPEPFALTDVAGQDFTDPFFESGRYNKTITRIPVTRGFEMRDLIAQGSLTADVHHAIRVFGAQGLRLINVGARYIGNGFVLQYVDGATIEDCWSEDSIVLASPFGRGIGLAEARNVTVRHFRCKGLKRFIQLEAGSDAQVFGGSFDNTGDVLTGASYGSDCYVFNAVSKSRLRVHDFMLTGHGGYTLNNDLGTSPDLNGAIRFFGRLTMIHPDEPFSMRLEHMNCVLDYRIGGVRQEWDFQNPIVWKRRIYLENGRTRDIYGPSGALKMMRVYASSGLTFGASGNVSFLGVGRPGGLGANSADELQPGKTVTLDFIGGTNAGIVWQDRGEPLRLRVTTAPGSDLTAAAQFIDVECIIAPDRLAPSIDWTDDDDARAAGPEGDLREAVFDNVDVPNIPSGATRTIDLPIPAITANDIVVCDPVLLSGLGGLSIRAAYAINGNCRIIFENQTGTAIDKAPTKIRVLWRKPLI